MPKDACYQKVKRRYKVFPSAYASGAIAKCRKVGAANWGNKSKKKADGGILDQKPSAPSEEKPSEGQQWRVDVVLMNRRRKRTKGAVTQS